MKQPVRCDHVQALSLKIIQDEKGAVTLTPLSSECIGLSTPHAFINRGSGGISHPRVNRGVKVLTTCLRD